MSCVCDDDHCYCLQVLTASSETNDGNASNSTTPSSGWSSDETKLDEVSDSSHNATQPSSTPGDSSGIDSTDNTTAEEAAAFDNYGAVSRAAESSAVCDSAVLNSSSSCASTRHLHEDSTDNVFITEEGAFDGVVSRASDPPTDAPNVSSGAASSSSSVNLQPCLWHVDSLDLADGSKVFDEQAAPLSSSSDETSSEQQPDISADMYSSSSSSSVNLQPCHWHVDSLDLADGSKVFDEQAAPLSSSSDVTSSEQQPDISADMYSSSSSVNLQPCHWHVDSLDLADGSKVFDEQAAPLSSSSDVTSSEQQPDISADMYSSSSSSSSSVNLQPCHWHVDSLDLADGSKVFDEQAAPLSSSSDVTSSEQQPDISADMYSSSSSVNLQPCHWHVDSLDLADGSKVFDEQAAPLSSSSDVTSSEQQPDISADMYSSSSSSSVNLQPCLWHVDSLDLADGSKVFDEQAAPLSSSSDVTSSEQQPDISADTYFSSSSSVNTDASSPSSSTECSSRLNSEAPYPVAAEINKLMPSSSAEHSSSAAPSSTDAPPLMTDDDDDSDDEWDWASGLKSHPLLALSDSDDDDLFEAPIASENEAAVDPIVPESDEAVVTPIASMDEAAVAPIAPEVEAPMAPIASVDDDSAEEAPVLPEDEAAVDPIISHDEAAMAPIASDVNVPAQAPVFADDQAAMSSTAPNTMTTPDFSFHGMKVLKCLGYGTFGVCLLVDINGTMYALKILAAATEAQKAETRREREMLERLRGLPTVMQLYAATHQLGKDWFLSELGVGGSLKSKVELGHGELDMNKKMKPVKGLRTEDLVFYAACIVKAVSDMHSRNVVHFDLKLDNIVITEDG